MSSGGDGRYRGWIPGQASGTVIQFYVEAEDTLGATATFPAAGADSRALVKVADGQGTDKPLHSFRLVMLQADITHLHDSYNALSNERIGATVVYGGEIYYDAGTRLKGSFVGRDAARVGFNIQFNPDRLFMGVHEGVAIDRSTHATLGVDEILVKHVAGAAGDIPSMYDDLVYFIGARQQDTQVASIRLAGFNDVYLDSQFNNGSDGTMYEYEVLRWATTTADGNVESLKRAGGLDDPNGFLSVDFQNFGSDKEDYRWNSLIVNNRTRDDYSQIMAFNQAFALSGEPFLEAMDVLIDVDEWLRTLAFQSLAGPTDCYYTGGVPHNFRLYVRPEDGKILYMPWDWDSAFTRATNGSLVGGGNIARLVNTPKHLRSYYGNLLDIIQTSFNADYMDRWTDHYGELAGQNFDGRLSYIQQRGDYVLSQLPAAFDFVLNDPGPIDVGESAYATLQGRAWIDVFEIRVAGGDSSLRGRLANGSANRLGRRMAAYVARGIRRHPYTIEALDRYGNIIASQTVEITSSLSTRPLEDYLRIDELMYHPADATPAEQTAGFGQEDFEYIELINTSQTQTLDLGGSRFVDGIEYVFPAGTMLSPGERIVVASNPAAMALRYDTTGMSLVGPFDAGRLANDGETICMTDAVGNLIERFAYGDAGSDWPAAADGDGPSLQRTSSGGRCEFCLSRGTPATSRSVRRACPPRRRCWRGSFFTAVRPGAINPRRSSRCCRAGLATPANISNFSGGINGLLIDLAHLPEDATLSLDDLLFRVGDDSQLDDWQTAAPPLGLTRLAGQGVGGTDRYEIVWTDGDIVDQWLEITIDAARIGLPTGRRFLFRQLRRRRGQRSVAGDGQCGRPGGDPQSSARSRTIRRRSTIGTTSTATRGSTRSI